MENATQTNWTGIIGIYSNAKGYSTPVEYLCSSNSLPPSFDNPEYKDRTEIPAIQTVQLPSEHGNGNDEWYFLFSSLGSSSVPINITFYIIEMQILSEGEQSESISLYSGQTFLFKVNFHMQ